MPPFLWCSLEYCSRQEEQRGVGGTCKRVLDQQFCFHDFPITKAHTGAVARAQDHFTLGSDWP